VKNFIQRFGKDILGVLHGFDRVRFRGTRRFLANVVGMMRFLWQRQVLLKDFKAFAGNITAQVRQAAEEVADQRGRPVEYLHNSVMDKEAWARQVAKRDGIQQGLIGVLKAVECCWSYEVGPNRAEKKLELRGKPSKCLHYYHYFMDPEIRFGLRALANLVSVYRSCGDEWSRVAGLSNGQDRPALPAA
jgi:hypothetical protein